MYLHLGLLPSKSVLLLLLGADQILPGGLSRGETDDVVQCHDASGHQTAD